jgi:hypothetical protein
MAYDIPRVPYIVRVDGPIHTRETSDSDDQLYEALTRTALVRPRETTFTPPPPSSEPPPSSSPPPTGRYKLVDSQCVWEPNDSGPDQCSPALPPSGRYKYDGWGVCYWEPNDSGPDQCSPSPPPGRYKLDGSGGCYWDANDDGPNQCVP